MYMHVYASSSSSCQFIEIVNKIYACIGMYMHVYVCICMYIVPAQVNVCISIYTCICIYMYVYLCTCIYARIWCICMYMMNIHVFCMYMHVFPEMIPSDTGTYATSPRHSIWGRQLAGHTLSTPGHPNIHFFSPSAKFVQTLFGAPHHAARVQGPWSCPLVPHGVLPCTIHALQSSLMACHSRSGRLASIQRPEGVGSPLSETPPDSDSLMSVYECI